MATYADLIVAALQDLGVLQAGETPTAEDAELARNALNRLLDAWGAEGLMLHATSRTVWTITANDGSYTVGAGADVDTGAGVGRPVTVQHVNIIDTSANPDQEIPLRPLTEDAYAAIPQKALTSNWPTHWYYNPTAAFATLILHPTPTATTLQGALYAKTMLSQAALASTVTVPPAYGRMIAKNLAVEVAPAFDRQPSQILMEAAVKSLAVVKRSNRRLADLSFEAGACVRDAGRYDIYSDTYR